MARFKIWSDCEAGEEISVVHRGSPEAGEVSEETILRGSESYCGEAVAGITLCVTKRLRSVGVTSDDFIGTVNTDGPADDAGAPDVVGYVIQYKDLSRGMMYLYLTDHKMNWTEDPDEALIFLDKRSAAAFATAMDVVKNKETASVGEYMWSST